MTPPPPTSTLFPYTTLFRSFAERAGVPHLAIARPLQYSAQRRCRSIVEIRRRGDNTHQTSRFEDRKSTRLNSSHGYISYAVFCLKKKKQTRRLQLARHASRT